LGALVREIGIGSTHRLHLSMMGTAMDVYVDGALVSSTLLNKHAVGRIASRTFQNRATYHEVSARQ
jgi:hypothetical protein